MFICEPCAKAQLLWGISRSLGPCEVCHEYASCFDIAPAPVLPDIAVTRGGGNGGNLTSQDRQGEGKTS